MKLKKKKQNSLTDKISESIFNNVKINRLCNETERRKSAMMNSTRCLDFFISAGKEDLDMKALNTVEILYFI